MYIKSKISQYMFQDMHNDLYIRIPQTDDSMKVVLDPAGNLYMSEKVNDVIGLDKEPSGMNNTSWYGLIHYDESNPNQLSLSFVYTVPHACDMSFIFHRYSNVFYLQTARFFNGLGEKYRDRPIVFSLERDYDATDFYYTYKMIRYREGEAEEQHKSRNKLKKGKKSI